MGSLKIFGKELLAFHKTLLFVLIPLLASPLLILSPIGEGPSKGAWVVIVMAGFWIFEVLPLAVTAMFPVILYPLLGVQDSDEVCRNYLKDTNWLFVGGLIVAVAVEHWNLHKRIALSVLMLMGSKPRWLMFGFMMTTAFLSMWISNTATTAMMIPIAQAVLLQLIDDKKAIQDTQDDDQVMVVANEQNEILPSNEHNDISPPQYGSVEMDSTYDNKVDMTLEERETQVDGDLETKNTSPEAETAEPEKETGHKAIQGDVIDYSKLSKEERDLSKGLVLCVCYAANIGGTATLTGTGPNLVIGGIVDDLYGDAAGLNFATWMFFALPGMVLLLFLAWVWLTFLYLGKSCFACWHDCKSCLTCGKKGNSDKTGHEVIKAEYKKLGGISWAETAVLFHFVTLALLWLLRQPGFIPGFGGWASIFPESGFITDATAAIFIAVSLFFFPSQPPNFLCCRRENDESPVGPRPALLDWQTAQRKLPWSVVILLGGGFALADGTQASGLSDWLAEQFASLNTIPVPVLVLIITVVICFFTEFTSNVSTATIFLPILATLAESLCVNPLYLMIPATIVCSYAFMLPVATPPNAIAFSYGTLTVPDMVKAGIMMNIVGIGVINLMINTLGIPMFDVLNYPDWAPDVNGTCRAIATTGMPNMTTMFEQTTTCVCY